MTVKTGESDACRGQAGCDKANMPEVLLFFANEDLCLDFLTYYTSFSLYRIREKKNSNIGIKYIGRVSVSEMMISMRKKNEMQNHLKSTQLKNVGNKYNSI